MATVASGKYDSDGRFYRPVLGEDSSGNKYVLITNSSGQLEVALVAGTNQIGARSKCALLNSGIKSASVAIKGTAGEVYWITISDTAALAIELNDHASGTGTDLWGVDMPADGYGHFIFDPPLEFGTAIYLNVSTGTCKVTVGYK